MSWCEEGSPPSTVARDLRRRSAVSSGWPGFHESDGSLVHATRHPHERRDECDVASSGNRAWQSGPDEIVKLRKVVARNFRKEMMLQMVVLVEEEEGDHRMRQHRSGREV